MARVGNEFVQDDDPDNSYGMKLGIGAQVFDPEKSVFLCPERLVVGDYSRIDGMVKLECAGGVELGRYVHIGSFVHVLGGGTLIVGDGVAITSHAVVVTGSNDESGYYMSSVADPDSYVVVRRTTRIDEGAFVGSGATILPGVHIGAFSIVGAGAVVTRDIPAGQVWMGVPARKIRDRRLSDKQVARLSVLDDARPGGDLSRLATTVWLREQGD